MTEQEFGLSAVDDIIRDSVTGRERHSVRWESFTDQFIDAIKTAKVYVDCGAEYGFYIRLALKYGLRNLRIIAFEPELARYEMLHRLFPQVELYPFALADKATNQFCVKPGPGVSLSFNGMMHLQGDSMLVNTIALDDLVDTADVIKIDIEGAEDLAFLGMARILKSKPKLFIEWHPTDVEIRRSTTDLLVAAGYALDEPIDCGRVVLE